jgi:nucleoside phosphorylase
MDRTLKVWDLATRQPIATWQAGDHRVRACAVTPDGERVVSASWDHTLKVWDLATGQPVATLKGHDHWVRACAVTPDGRYVVSASLDTTLKVWDLATGHPVATLRGHAARVNACAVTPDGRRVVSASDDNTLKVWDLASGACLLTHRANAAYHAVAATTTAVVAGDAAGSVWFLDWPSSDRRVLVGRDDRGRDDSRTRLPDTASRDDAGSAATPQPSRPGVNSAAAPKVDIGILTIRDDEFRAVLAAFPDKAGTHKGASLEYALRYADAGNGARYRIAVVRQVAQGTGEAQDAARDLIDDLAPRLVVVVGIAGGLPSDDVRLGDVVVSTRIHDFTLEARKTGQAPSYDVTGGPVDRALQSVVANLAAREDELGNWTANLPPAPHVAWTQEGQLYGPPEWQGELRAKLEHHHGTGSTSRPPAYAAGPIASSDRLVKEPELLIPWLQSARSLLAIEMEAAGVYRAARQRCPMLAIRGISDIVGLKRADAWTKYACASAAAFTRAFLRTRPVEVGSTVGGAADSSSERHRSEQ